MKYTECGVNHSLNHACLILCFAW